MRGSLLRPRGERARLRARQRRHPRGRRTARGRRRRPRRGRRASRVDWGADLVVIGPEVPLVAGAADAVRDAGIACFGPSAAGRPARGQQVLRQARDGRRRACRPRARGRSAARRSWRRRWTSAGAAPYVVKDDGLAAGKGVLVTDDRAAAVAHGHRGARRRRGGAGRGVPRRPRGVAVRGHRRDDGAAAACPPRTSSAGTTATAARTPAGWAPTRRCPWAPAGPGRRGAGHGAAADRRRDGPPRGDRSAACSTPGWRSPRAGVRVVEFNARFGDPETQVVLPLLETPLAGLLHAAATGTLADHPPLRWRDGAAVTVVVAAPGYPESPRTGVAGHRRRRRGRAARRHRASPPTARWSRPAGRVLSVVGAGRRPRRRPAGRLRAGGRRAAGRRALAHRHRAGRRRGPDQSSSSR